MAWRMARWLVWRMAFLGLGISWVELGMGLGLGLLRLGFRLGMGLGHWMGSLESILGMASLLLLPVDLRFVALRG